MSGVNETRVAPGRAGEDLDEVASAYISAAASVSEAERQRLREDMVRHCLPFAGRMARRYAGRGESLEDLEQVARMGLVKAVDRYDPERGSFTAYAVITVSGEIKRHFRDKAWGVRVPRRLQELSLGIGQATTALTHQLSRSPTVAEVARYLQATEEAVLEAMEGGAGYTLSSLNAPVGGEGNAELGDLYGAPDVDLESVDDRLTVERLLYRLPPRERQILALRFYGNHTQAEIAAEVCISQMHVSRLISRSLAWLREAMLNDAAPDWHGGAGQPDTDGLRVTVTRPGQTVCLAVAGEVDRDSAQQLRTALLEAAATAGADELRVDLTAVPLVDAAGVAALVAGRQAAESAGRRMRLVGFQPYVARILAVSGLAALMH